MVDKSVSRQKEINIFKDFIITLPGSVASKEYIDIFNDQLDHTIQTLFASRDTIFLHENTNLQL